MNYVNLGRTGVKVSPLCLGCMNFGGKTSAEDSYAIIDRAIEAGINFLDTANVYGRGASEEVVGEALKRNGKRDQVIIATKVFGRMGDGPNDYGGSRRHIFEQCNASLRRLQTDRIDLYQLHSPSTDIPIDETLRALDDLVRSGRVLYIAVSNYPAWRLMEALWVSKELGLNRFVCNQPPYNILDRRVERDLLPMARTYGLGVIAWSPLAMGLLTGKYRRNKKPAADTRFANVANTPRLQRRMNPHAFDLLEGLEPVVKEKACTMSQFSLAFLMAQPGLTAPIIGPRTMEQLEDHLGALDVTVTDDDRAKVDELVPPGRMVSPFYEPDMAPLQYRW